VLFIASCEAVGHLKGYFTSRNLFYNFWEIYANYRFAHCRQSTSYIIYYINVITDRWVEFFSSVLCVYLSVFVV